MRGRNRGGGKNHNPLTRVYESNGPDVKIRGTANHIAEKYIQLARDATASGDPVAAENYYQHAEHYFRLIAAAQEQFRQTQPFQQRAEGGEARADENFDDAEDSMQPYSGGSEPHAQREQQAYAPREQQQPYPQREQQPRHEQRHEQRHAPRQQATPVPESADIGLPSFITGAQPDSPGAPQNGHEGQTDRFPLHRRRRRGQRAPRGETAGAPAADTQEDSAAGNE
jgi:hypothetical protein